MVSCGPAPPPQCSWFSSAEREDKRESELRLNSMGCQNHLRSRVPDWINRHSVAWVELEREETANQASKTSYRPSDTDQHGLFWDGGCRRDREATTRTTESLVSSCSPTEGHTGKFVGLASLVGMSWSRAVCVCVTGPGHTHT